MTAPPPDPLPTRSRAAAAVVWDYRRTLRLVIVAVVVGVAINVGLTLLTKDRVTLDALDHIAPGWLAVALVLALVPWLAEAVRLTVWARFFGRAFHVGDGIRCVVAGQVAQALAPIAVGNAAAKTAMMVQRGLTPAEAAATEGLSVVEDFLFFVIALPLAAVLTGAWHHPIVASAEHAIRLKFTDPWVVAGFIAASLLAAAAVVWLARRRGRLFGFRAALGAVGRRGKTRFVFTVLIAAVHWSSRYSVVAALAMSLGVHENPVRLFFLQWFVFTMMTFVPLPGAAVGAESAFFLVYGAILPEWSLGVMTAGWRLFSFYLPVMIAAALMIVLPQGRAPLPHATTPGSGGAT